MEDLEGLPHMLAMNSRKIFSEEFVVHKSIVSLRPNSR